MSLLDRRRLPASCSGAMYCGVPATSAAPIVAAGRRDAEVGDADVAVAVDHHVGRLEIAVQHAAFVRRGDAGAQLPRESIALSCGMRPMRRSSDARSSPSTYSIVRKRRPSASPRS
jgi:hypothetical protein